MLDDCFAFPHTCTLLNRDSFEKEDFSSEGRQDIVRYENTPIQYNGTFHGCNKRKVSDEKNVIFLLFLLDEEIVDTR